MADARRFPYRTRQGARGFPFKRPLLSAMLASTHKRRKVEALVDTGADVNILPHTVGLELGLIWSAHPSGGTVSGGLRVSETRLLRLGIELATLPIVELIFAWLEHDDAPLALGTIDFLLKFDVCFAAGLDYFEITPRTTP